VLWFLGGLGLAGTSGFALATGESHITAHAQWTEAICTFAGVITGAAVLRAGFRIFWQLGDAGPKDKSADIPETPEINGQNQTINWFLFLPAALCIAGSVILAFCRPITAAIFSAAIRFMDFRSYAHAVYAMTTPLPLLSAPRLNLQSVLLSGCLRALLAIVVALWAVFHLRVPRLLRWPSHMEGSMRSIRALQSGHVGDYVTWLTVGCAVIGAVVFWLGA
jgi:multicomponent Na+:H+ antiporter subunit D